LRFGNGGIKSLQAGTIPEAAGGRRSDMSGGTDPTTNPCDTDSSAFGLGMTACAYPRSRRVRLLKTGWLFLLALPGLAFRAGDFSGEQAGRRPAEDSYAYRTQSGDSLERGYYGWREAKILCLYFNNGTNIRLAPDLNDGTVAVMYYFSKMTGTPAAWSAAVEKFFALHTSLFGDPRATAAEPLFPGELYQPYLILPFSLGQSWCFSYGPHGVWDSKGPAAALDFAPPQDECSDPLTRMILASAPGCVVRSEKNAVVLDLDCDGSERTGWNLFYYHLAEEGRARQNSRVAQGQKIGYASCEGGLCSGIHVHMARRYNGEWILAGGPIPFTLSGWQLGTFESDETGAGWKYFRGGRAVVASVNCYFENMIAR
jgi:LasA protease